PHTNPCMRTQGQQCCQTGNTHPGCTEKRLPLCIIQIGGGHDISEQPYKIHAQHNSADTLHQPVRQATATKTGNIPYHIHTPVRIIVIADATITSTEAVLVPSRVSAYPRSMTRCLMPANR